MTARTLTILGLLVSCLALPNSALGTTEPPAPDEPSPVVDELLWWTGNLRIPGEKRPLVPPWNLEQGANVVLSGGATAWILERGYGLRVLRGPGVWRVASRSFTGPGSTEGVALEPPPGIEQASPWYVTPGLSPWKPDFRDDEPLPMRPIHTTTENRSPSLAGATSTRSGEVTITLWKVQPGGDLQLLENWRGAPGPTLRPWTALEPGAAYLWRTRREEPGGGEVVERLAPFAVLSEVSASTLEEALKAIDSMALGRGDRGALRASLLTVFGLREEAVATWREVAASGLGRPEVKPAIKRAMGIRVKHPTMDAAMPPLPFGLRRD